MCVSLYIISLVLDVCQSVYRCFKMLENSAIISFFTRFLINTKDFMNSLLHSW